jgi:predicted Rossmann-fold nucleotide-binding protein
VPDDGTASERVPDGLYRIDALLGGWAPDDDLSYARTVDALTYRRAGAEGLRVPRSTDVARRRALHDQAITQALSQALGGRRVVAFMGGHRLGRDTPAYEVVARCARSLAARGLLVVSGGGPGAMEAAHLGARLARAPSGDLDDALDVLRRVAAFPEVAGEDLVRSDGTFDEGLLRALHRWQAPAFEVAARWPEGVACETIGIPTWLYGHEPPTPLATAHAKYFDNSVREDGLLAVAKAGVVFAEGSAGTLQEVFQDAAQNHYRSVDDTRSPMVFLDIDRFWTVIRPVRPLLEGLFDDEMDAMLHFVETAEDAAAAILGHPAAAPPLPPDPLLRPGSGATRFTPPCG